MTHSWKSIPIIHGENNSFQDQSPPQSDSTKVRKIIKTWYVYIVWWCCQIDPGIGRWLWRHSFVHHDSTIDIFAV